MENNIIKNVDGIIRADSNEVKKSRDLVLTSIGEEISEIAKEPIKETRKSDRRIDSLSKDATRFFKKTAPEAASDPQGLKDIPSIVKDKSSLESSLGLDKEIKPLLLKKSNIEVEKKPAITRAKKPTPSLSNSSQGVNTHKTQKAKGMLVKKSQKHKVTETKKDNSLGLKSKTNYTTSAIKKTRQIKSTILIALKAALAYIFLAISFFALLYLIIVFVVLRFGKQSAFITNFSNFVTVPTLVSSDGIINFAKYKKLYEVSNVSSGDKQAFNQEMAKVFVLNKLFKKHNVNNVDSLKDVLSTDEDVNVAPLSRIRKIKAGILNQDDFVKTAKKFGDVGQANVNTNNFSEFDFAPYIKNIQETETSNIIIAKSGYYIIHCFSRVGDELTLNYVHIPSVSLEEYLQDQAESYKYWNLANF